MATCIQTKSGPSWYTDWSIPEVRAAIREDETITVWWFAPWGQRFKENVFLAAEELAFIRTESDDG